MSLELSPYSETILQQEATRRGITPDDLIERTFGKPTTVPAAIDPETERVFALLRERQREYGLPIPPGGFKSLKQLFAEWNTEDSKMTDDEREEERRFWEDYEKGRDDRRLEI